MKERLWNLVGLICALSLVVMTFFFLSALLRRDFSQVMAFLEFYRGGEVFFIFVLPIIVIGGGAWLWRFLHK